MTETTASEEKKRKHGPLPFVLAGISFIPIIGVVFGLLCIVIAIAARKANSLLLALIGAGGILFTILLFGVILPSTTLLLDDGMLSEQFEPHSKSSLTTLVRLIEFYKQENQRYPANIEELRSSLKEGELVMTYDMAGPIKLGEKPREFYYEVIDNGERYLLFGLGSDDEPFTDDDIYPNVDPAMQEATGWSKSR